MKSLKIIATVTLFALATVSFAAAQAEINPDHFPDPPAAPVKAEVQAQINNLQAKVQGCEARMRAEQEKLETLRQEAVSAGATGDGAGDFVSAYMAEKETVDATLRTLAMEMTAANKDIASLEMDGVVVAEARGGKNTTPVLMSTRF
jgi:chaperonin cofactor prefoldin